MKVPKLMIIIDNPTFNEALAGEVCYGLPRRLIDTLVKTCIKGHKIIWTSAIKEGYELGKIVPVGVWRKAIPSLQAEIAQEKPDRILCLGSIALSMVMNNPKKFNIQHMHGLGMVKEYVDNEGIARTAYVVGTYNPYTVLKDTDYYRDVAFDIQKLASNDKPISINKIKMLVAKKPSDVAKILAVIEDEALVSCDVETTGLDARVDTLESIGFGLDDGRCFIIPKWVLNDVGVKRILKDYYTNYFGTTRKESTLVFHNAKFDLKFIARYIGSNVVMPIADTLLMHYATDERPIGKFAAHSLKDLSRLYFDVEDYKFNFKKWNDTPEEKRDYNAFFKYQSLDLFYTIQLYPIMLSRIAEEDKKLYDVVCRQLLFPASKVFAKAELRGIKLDTEYLQERISEYEGYLAYCTNQLKLLVSNSFNPLSPKQVHEYVETELHTRAKARRVSNKGVQDMGTSKDELEQYMKLGNELQKLTLELIIEARNLNKILSTYLKGLLKSSVNNRISTEIRLPGTATGRLSSGEPNLQNIPSRLGKVIKNAFVADDGYTLLEVDYSQLELRMAAYISQDSVMAETFNKGIDMHRLVASNMFNKPMEDITSFERFLAKAVDFGVLYGRGASALVDGVEMDYYVKLGGTRPSVEQMQLFIDNFLGGFPTLQKWIKVVSEGCIKYQYVQTIFSRRRRFPFIMQGFTHKGEVIRQAVNTCIQSAASDLCLSAANKLDKILEQKYGDDAQLLLTVHDSILVQCKDELVQEVYDLMVNIMSRGIIKTDFIHFDVEGKYGKKWGELKEFDHA